MVPGLLLARAFGSDCCRALLFWLLGGPKVGGMCGVNEDEGGPMELVSFVSLIVYIRRITGIVPVVLAVRGRDILVGKLSVRRFDPGCAGGLF